ncbi:SPRY domain-containing SOCS box protein 3 [Drosophila elegans]|uniref:SPRY domain-containing SOCS box protein 3 n=1 Tax=Drosophila elegans TaxID=30023 RepID=UPI001BC832F3|nr:SPRY domain-containing SOCS box protein 3 [Drosophila elegans]
MSSRFCDCRFPSSTEIWSHMGHITDLTSCRCGKFGIANANPWLWDSNGQSDALIAGEDIVFHPTRSRGTAMVRGNRSLEPGMVHYWEMLAISPLVGSDVMFGIGMQSVDLTQHEFKYVSALGSDDYSWGISYSGNIQHCAKQSSYGQNFSQGCLIGVCLDRSRGHLEFYLNRRSLGVAFTNVPVDPTVHIYPMVCSTSFRTVIRLINSTSVPDTLLLRSFQTLSIQKPEQLFILRQIPGLWESHWFLDMPTHGSR